MCVLLQSLFAEKSQQKCSVRLAGPGREIFILKIAGSNPAPSTNKKNRNNYGTSQVSKKKNSFQRNKKSRKQILR